MTRRELQLLRPAVSRLRALAPDLWNALKHETQFGPQSSDFPYFPSALELD
jgi:hypothetical protein